MGRRKREFTLNDLPGKAPAEPSAGASRYRILAPFFAGIVRERVGGEVSIDRLRALQMDAEDMAKRGWIEPLTN